MLRESRGGRPGLRRESPRFERVHVTVTATAPKCWRPPRSPDRCRLPRATMWSAPSPAWSRVPRARRQMSASRAWGDQRRVLRRDVFPPVMPGRARHRRLEAHDWTPGCRSMRNGGDRRPLESVLMWRRVPGPASSSTWRSCVARRSRSRSSRKPRPALGHEEATTDGTRAPYMVASSARSAAPAGETRSEFEHARRCPHQENRYPRQGDQEPVGAARVAIGDD